MKRIATVLLLAISSQAFAFGTLIGEKKSGLTKICYYDTPRGEVAITIKSYEVCPVSIR